MFSLSIICLLPRKLTILLGFGKSLLIIEVNFFSFLVTLYDSLALIAGLLFASAFFFDVFGYAKYDGMTPFGSRKYILQGTSDVGYVIAGLFVGIGSKLIY